MRKLALVLFSTAMLAQPQRLVRAVGEANVSVKPDEARLSVAVTTQATTAEQAAAQNATIAEAVMARLRQVLGRTGDLETVGYSIYPNMKCPQGESCSIAGYTCNNTLQVRTSDLGLPGRLIDNAIQAGATSIAGLSFSLRDDSEVKGQALGLAAKQARAHAEAIAAGLGAKLGAILSAAETGTTRIIPYDARAGGATFVPTTPVEPGLVQVYATVTLEVELIS